MIKVGLFIDTFFPMVDGVINVVDNYAKRMNDDEFEVIVFAPKTRHKGYVDNFPYKVQRCKSMKVLFLDYDLPMPKFDRQFKKALKESNLDIVHIHSPFTIGKIGVLYAKKHNIPCVATLHSQFKKDIYRSTHSKLLTKWILSGLINVFNDCDEYYGVNGRISEIFQEYGTSHLPLVQRNGTDFLPIENEKEAIKTINQKFDIPENMPVFLFVGRINALKNIYFTIEALSKLEDKNFKMIFVGDGQDMDELKRRIKKFDIEDNVILTGKIMDRELLKAIYLRAKLFLFPSMYDASSLVQIEAAAQKTPTIFLEGAATSATVTDNVNGFISKPSPEKFAEKIQEILNNEELYNKVQVGAVRDLYVSWDDTVREMKGKYKEIIEIKQKELASLAKSPKRTKVGKQNI